MKTIFTLLLLLAFSFSQAQMNVGGTVTTPDGDPIVNATVILNGSENYYTLTEGDGTYLFDVPVDVYNVSVCADKHPPNGVTTFDLVLIHKHYTGEELLDSPYRIIAADVNGDQQVDVQDSITMSHLILGLENEFPVPSWKFVDAGFVFADPQNPFSPSAPETVTINGLDAVQIDFIGVKIGDLNGSAAPGVFINVGEGSCSLINANISGNVYYDTDENCSADGGDTGLQDWIVTVEGNGNVRQTTTDENGAYAISVLPGDYSVSVTPPNALWTNCQESYTVSTEQDGAYQFDFFAQKLIDCPLMQVDIGTPFIRRCFTSNYYIRYCNQGTITATDATVEVKIDSLLTVTYTSIPYASLDGNLYTFDLGDLEVNECGTITIEVLASCESELGQVFCSEAHAYPDALCVPPSAMWDGSSLELDAKCIGEQVRFTVRNAGAAMTQAVPFIIIEDDMIMNISGGNDPILLNELESTNIDLPANGSTWRIEVEQSAGHPYSDLVTAAVEGCGTNSEGNFSMGFVTLFPLLTHSGAVDIECAQGVGSWDPNDKSAIPAGVGEEHFIERNVNLDYRIRFQNTGTDTAFTVVIRDTLSEYLEATSIRPGVSSHPYEFELLENNVAEFRFLNIMLPDSNVNEVASHGFVKLNIAQKMDNPLGTLIENKAAIYFDFNEPVITNTVQHTVGENFLEIVNSIIRGSYPTAEITVAPHPMSNTAVISLGGLELQNGRLIVYDLMGRPVQNYLFNGSQVEISKNQLSSGLYIFEISDNGKSVGSGKLSIKN